VRELLPFLSMWAVTDVTCHGGVLLVGPDRALEHSKCPDGGPMGCQACRGRLRGTGPASRASESQGGNRSDTTVGKGEADGTERFLAERLGRHMSPEVAMTSIHAYEGGEKARGPSPRSPLVTSFYPLQLAKWVTASRAN
jgi:hypothetical protein